MEKNEIRKSVLGKRNNLSHEAQCLKSEAIFESIKNLAFIKETTCVASFVNFKSEVQTDAINQLLLDLNKILLLPRIDPSLKIMQFYQVTDLNQLIVSPYGIREPNPLIHPHHPSHAIDLVLTPGVAFDNSGYRIGYGGGYYDRLFASISEKVPRIGVAFAIQSVPNIPIDTYDQPVHALVTENGLKNFKTPTASL